MELSFFRITSLAVSLIGNAGSISHAVSFPPAAGSACWPLVTPKISSSVRMAPPAALQTKRSRRWVEISRMRDRISEPRSKMPTKPRLSDREGVTHCNFNSAPPYSARRSVASIDSTRASQAASRSARILAKANHSSGLNQCSACSTHISQFSGRSRRFRWVNSCNRISRASAALKPSGNPAGSSSNGRMSPVTAGLATAGETRARGARFSPASLAASTRAACSIRSGAVACNRIRRRFRRYPITPAASTPQAPANHAMAR